MIGGGKGGGIGQWLACLAHDRETRVRLPLDTFRIPLEKVFNHHYLGNSVVVVWLLSKLVITGP